MSKKDRDGAGRFAQGNKGGPGRPKRHVEVEYMRSMLKICSLAEWEQIVKTAVEAAKKGDHKARDWLTSHVLGPSGARPATYTRLTTEQEAEEEFSW